MFIPALSICSPSVLHLIFKLFIDSIHILFLLYLLLWFWDFTIKNLQDFIKIYRALIKCKRQDYPTASTRNEELHNPISCNSDCYTLCPGHVISTQ